MAQLADHDVIAQGVRADRFLEEARFYFGKLREAYKETIAQNYESPSQDGDVEIDRVGHKIAILAELEQQLETIAAGGELAARENEDKQ